MNTLIKQFISLSSIFILTSCNLQNGNENTVVDIKTTLGDIKIRLYDGTPLHRDNFIKLVNMGFYEGVSFHRVIKDFMIQAGDPLTRTAKLKDQSDTLNTYTIPAEIRKEYFHKKGALAAAREGNDVNPDMASSGTQFYIVQGVKISESEIPVMEERINSSIRQAKFNKYITETADSIKTAGASPDAGIIQERAADKMFQYLSAQEEYKLLPDQINTYKSAGGVPRLDGTYTVFGEVIEGLDVVDKIAAVKTSSSDKPLSDVKIIRMKIVK